MGHKKLDELKGSSSYKDICDAKKDLLEVFMAELHTKGASGMDTKESGEVIDMVKDLAMAEKYCMEACYYEHVIKAMEDSEDDDEDGRMGYNNRRYSSGRYAPKGKGTRMGYNPYASDMPFPEMFWYDPNYMDEYVKNYQNRPGYSPDRDRKESRNWDNQDIDNSYGRTYNDYKKAKRHYTESNSSADKQEMNDRGMRHVNEAISTFREIWRDADPEMRKRMKDDMTKLVGEMAV